MVKADRGYSWRDSPRYIRDDPFIDERDMEMNIDVVYHGDGIHIRDMRRIDRNRYEDDFWESSGDRSPPHFRSAAEERRWMEGSRRRRGCSRALYEEMQFLDNRIREYNHKGHTSNLLKLTIYDNLDPVHRATLQETTDEEFCISLQWWQESYYIPNMNNPLIRQAILLVGLLTNVDKEDLAYFVENYSSLGMNELHRIRIDWKLAFHSTIDLVQMTQN